MTQTHMARESEASAGFPADPRKHIELGPGAVYIDKGEPTAAEIRDLRLDLTAEQSDLLDYVMTQYLDKSRSMTAADVEQYATDMEKILDEVHAEEQEEAMESAAEAATKVADEKRAES